MTNNFHQAVKSKKCACKTLRVWTRKDRFLKILKKILRFFDQNLYGKLTFFANFHEISQIISASAPKVLPLEDNTRFLQQFFRFRGGGNVLPVPPSLRHWGSPEIIFHSSCFSRFPLIQILGKRNSRRPKWLFRLYQSRIV